MVVWRMPDSDDDESDYESSSESSIAEFSFEDWVHCKNLLG